MARGKFNFTSRPDTPRRAVVWFPTFQNSNAIDRYRGQRDPLGNIAPPHLTLVFPFHSRLTLDQLTAHVQKMVRSMARVSGHHERALDGAK